MTSLVIIIIDYLSGHAEETAETVTETVWDAVYIVDVVE